MVGPGWLDRRFNDDKDALWIRSFAAGPVFSVAGDRPSGAHFLAAAQDETAGWLDASSKTCTAAFDTNWVSPSKALPSALIVMARGKNASAAVSGARSFVAKVRAEIARKKAEDAAFWSTAPQLTGDWPIHWERGWVYDFETLRMMVRRPVGLY